LARGRYESYEWGRSRDFAGNLQEGILAAKICTMKFREKA
jgi:hypothetical protein